MGWRRRIGLGVGALIVAATGLVWSRRAQTRLRLAPETGEVTTLRDVAYLPDGHPKHRLDVYLPADANGVPVVHFVHGGYWVEGDKDFHHWLTGLYGTVGLALASRGIATVVQSYRLSPEVDIDGIVADVTAGIAWTRANIAAHGGDPEALFLMGHSAGGHLVTLVANREPRERVRGVVALSPVLDLGDMQRTQDATFNAEVTAPVFGNRLSSHSPSELWTASTPPTLFVLGSDDYPYLLPQAARATERLRELGVAVDTHTVPGLDHAGVVLAFGAEGDAVTPRVAEWIHAQR